LGDNIGRIGFGPSGILANEKRDWLISVSAWTIKEGKARERGEKRKGKIRMKEKILLAKTIG
jgi:hypothetical protein